MNIIRFSLLIMPDDLTQLINQYQDFPEKGILFQDISPLLEKPNAFLNVINQISSSDIFDKADAIISIDARGFIFGTAIAMKLSKPMVLARKPNKLPGKILSKSYELEYGKNTLSVQESALENYKSFAIVDDLLATGGSAKCVSDILNSVGKLVVGLSVLIELGDLQGRKNLPFPVYPYHIL